MTKDEAIEALYKIHYPDDFRYGGAILAAMHTENKKSVERHVAGLVALGILKLDTSPSERIARHLAAYDRARLSATDIIAIMSAAGLKIVEKDK